MPIVYALLALTPVVILLAFAAWLYLRPPSTGPDVKCLILPPYEIPEVVVVGTVLVENRGHAPAHNLRLDIEYGRGDWPQIHHIRILSDARYVLRGGGEHHAYANLRLARLLPGQKIVIYMAGPRAVTPHVKVRVLGPAVPAPPESETALSPTLPSVLSTELTGDSGPAPALAGSDSERLISDPNYDVAQDYVRPLSEPPGKAVEPGLAAAALLAGDVTGPATVTSER